MLTIDDPAQFVAEKLARFVQAYGPGAYNGDLETLENEILWFSNRNRLWTITVHGALAGVGTGLRYNKPEDADEQDWFARESTTGLYFYVRMFVIHNDFRHYRISKCMVGLIRNQFVGLKYLVWRGNENLYIKHIGRMLGERKG